MKTIENKKALVTGAASGIGRQIALALAREGADVWLWDIDEAQLAKVVSEIQSLGVEAIGTHCDVSQPTQISGCINDVLDRWGGVDILVNNAGVAFYGPTDNMTGEQWDWLMSINLLAPIQITRELMPSLKDRAEAHIVNMCSIAGLVAGGRFAAYHTSKFGLVGFTEATRAEYSRQGVGVSAICPGPVRTSLYKNGISGRKDKPVPEPPRWICTTEEKVAKKVVKAIRCNKRMVLITPLAYLLFNVHRFAPWFIDFMNQFGRGKRLRRKQEQYAEQTRKAA